MTREEIIAYLHDEESVPVRFLKACDGLGFLIDPNNSVENIPKDYPANIPLWLAIILADPNVEIVSVNEPKWLSSLGPGSTINDSRSYELAASIGATCRNYTTIQQLIELIKERLDKVMNASYRTRGRQLDKEEPAFFIEEDALIQDTKEAYRSFLQWKSGGTNMPQSF